MPVAGVTQFDDANPIRPIRLFGENLVLYRDPDGKFGLVDRYCAHRGADLSYGMVEEGGIRCSYHGWKFGPNGLCVKQPFEDTALADRPLRRRPGIIACPLEVKAELVWVYMGPQPAPLVSDWEQFSWENGFAQIVISEISCNWLQCQENSIDPVHFEWMHDNWGARMRDPSTPNAPRHLKLDFEEFEYGFVYKRIREDTSEADSAWTVGRVCLWPNAFFLGAHFEWRVPVDDENTWITSHVMNQ
jgi:5,5'-dehydrodivanillate O-demethylase